MKADVKSDVFNLDREVDEEKVKFYKNIFYIKACVLNNSARAPLAFQVTYFPTRNRIKI